jgi:NADPH:quinone reductase-like Zn-dependent oxidoreductase
VIELGHSVVLPGGSDPVLVAAAMNPLMSSWVALRRRIDFHAGQKVLVLGATGSAGRMAVQVARRFGAGQVIAAGREETLLAELPALGADLTCTFDQLAVAADVDVVLDYVWGELPDLAVAIAEGGFACGRVRCRSSRWSRPGARPGSRATGSCSCPERRLRTGGDSRCCGRAGR